MTLMELLPVRDVTACCSPLTGEVMAQDNAVSLSSSLRALADPAVRAHTDGKKIIKVVIGKGPLVSVVVSS